MQSGAAKPVLLGVLDPNPSGAAFAMSKDLPVVKDGRVFVSLADANAKEAPAGDALLEAKIGAPAKAAAADDAE